MSPAAAESPPTDYPRSVPATVRSSLIFGHLQVPTLPPAAESSPEDDQEATEELASQRDCLMTTFGALHSLKNLPTEPTGKHQAGGRSSRRITDDTLPVA